MTAAMAAFVAVTALIMTRSRQAAEPPVSGPDPTTERPARAPEVVPDTAAVDDAVIEETLSAYRSNWELGDKVRAFAETSRTMPLEERERRGAELIAEVDRARAEGLLVADQPLFMKIAIYRSVFQNDEEGLARVVETLRAQRAEELASRPPVDHGPLYDQYKVREAEIVQEVLAMETYPDGLSRSAYLAQRLQEAREEIYGTGEEP